jgi:hypothetical protein
VFIHGNVKSYPKVDPNIRQEMIASIVVPIQRYVENISNPYFSYKIADFCFSKQIKIGFAFADLFSLFETISWPPRLLNTIHRNQCEEVDGKKIAIKC